MTSIEERKAMIAGRAIKLTMAIDGTPEKIWKAIVTPVMFATWCYPDRVEVDKIEVGGVYGFITDTADDEDGAEILEMDAPKYLKWRWYSSEPAPTILEWTLEPQDGYTLVHFVNSGFLDTPEWNKAYTQDFEGWVALHLQLKQYIETGKVTPPEAEEAEELIHEDETFEDH